MFGIGEGPHNRERQREKARNEHRSFEGGCSRCRGKIVISKEVAIEIAKRLDSMSRGCEATARLYSEMDFQGNMGQKLVEYEKKEAEKCRALIKNLTE